jgi:hypothetical protein
MMVTNRYKISLLILGALILLFSCQDAIIPPDNNVEIVVEESDDLVPVTLNLKDIFGAGTANTYGLTDIGAASGTTLENLVTDVTVYIFKANGVCEKILQGTGSSLPIGPELITTGVKDFVAIANAGGNNVTGLPGPGYESTITYSTLHRWISEEKTIAPESAFLMTGIKQAVSIPKQTAILSQSVPVSIEVARAVAKVTLHITKSDKAETKNIVMSKLTLINGADRVGLFETPDPNPAQYDIKTECSDFSNYDGMVSVGTIPKKDDYPNGCVPLDTFYTYENLADRNKSRATYFELEANVGGVTRTGKVYLAQDDNTSDTVWNVKRNYWYDVYLDITDPGFDSLYITVKSCPWNLADTQKVVAGGGYQVFDMASPFKLVKNYTKYEINKQTNIAAIDKHTKGASWVDFAVTDGYPWKLEFDSGTENTDAIMSIDGGASWSSGRIVGMGDDQKHRVYIYRPYVENAEPKLGPTFSLTVGGVLSNGNVTGGIRSRDFVVQPRDTTPIPTNCYILRPALSGVPANKTHAYIPLEGVYRYWEDYLMENGDSIPTGTVEAELLWQDRPGQGNVVKNISVKNATKRDSAYIYAEAGPVQGNAVVAMKVNGKIYWSFHLWVTEYNPYEAAGQMLYTGTIQNIFMDRNLGALSNEYDAAGEARGLFYQFGRKDPFPRGTAWNGGTNFMWYDKSGSSLGTITVLSTPLPVMPSTKIRPLEAIPETLRNPTVFYDVSPWPLSVENDSIWDTQGGNKSAFDPCPEGWRVPPQRESGIAASPWAPISLPPAPSTNGFYYLGLGYFPFSGYIVGGSIVDPLNRSYFWASYNGSSNATGLAVEVGNNIYCNPSILKNSAVSVRCVVDIKYLMIQGGGLFGNGAGSGTEEIL